jgi:hypothetical protein
MEKSEKCPKDNEDRYIKDNICAETGHCLHPGCCFNPKASKEEETEGFAVKYTGEEYAKEYAEFLRQISERDEQDKNKQKSERAR